MVILVYKFKRIRGISSRLSKFKTVRNRYKRMNYNMTIKHE